MLEEITKDNCGECLKLICDGAGMSLKKLAEVLDEKQSTLSHIKRGPEPPGRPPSQNFMNKLRALSLIGPSGRQDDASQGAKLTPAAVVAGLSAMARTKLLGTVNIIAGALAGGIVGAVVSFGVFHALDSICRKFGLSYKEANDDLEISRISDGPTKDGFGRDK
jgi:hypothetical protein